MRHLQFTKPHENDYCYQFAPVKAREHQVAGPGREQERERLALALVELRQVEQARVERHPVELEQLRAEQAVVVQRPVEPVELVQAVAEQVVEPQQAEQVLERPAELEFAVLARLDSPRR